MLCVCYEGDIIAEPSKNAQDLEAMLRGDVAKGWDTKIQTKQTDNRVDAEFTDVMVTRNTPNDPDEEMLKSILHIYDEIQSKDQIDTATLTVKIEDEPINEYEDNHTLLHLAFPLLFPLGVTSRQIRSTGLLQTSTTRRLLCSADGRFARSKPFQFLLMNQKLRHDNNRTTALRINANTEMSKEFVRFVNSEEFDGLCRGAIGNPNGKEARMLLSKVRPFVSLCGQTTKWSALERAAVKGKLFSMAQIFTPKGLFVTYSPKALDCWLVIRNSAIQLGLMDDEIKELVGPGCLNERVRMVSDNPVAQARAFEHMTRGFCKVILGLNQHDEPENREIRKKYPRGLFGTPLAYFGPIETQHRGTLHLHLLLQVAELRPALFQRFVDDPKVMEIFIRQIDSVTSGSIRGFEHVEVLARKEKADQKRKINNMHGQSYSPRQNKRFVV